ncbi:MAG: TRAP transporter permease [Alphaproteobacteria bacterium]|nr:TRAP transporter permease [Alphaproteobacteria bacterium]
MQAHQEAEGATHGPTTAPIFWIGVAFSSFQLVTAAYSPLSSLVVRSVHVGFLMLMVFAFFAALHRGRRIVIFDWALGGLGFLLAFYHWVFEAELVLRSGDPSTMDLVVGTLAVALVFEAARRMMGPALPLICGAFLAYALAGEWLPGGLAHRGYGYDQVINQLYLGTEGIYSIPTYVSSTYIFLFILFGSFLEQAGMIRLFTDVAMGLVGHTRGGPAKVSVVSSGLMGTINGSGVANVVTTGQFTIPLMKRFGYRADFAGAVEATASMGGQIMPPVMGAVAFIMAETLNIDYVEVVQAALVPAILYFATVLWMVHLEAGRLGLVGLPREDCPSAMGALRVGWHLILPLAALVGLLFSGYTPLFSGTVGLALTAVVILGTPIAARMGPLALRMLFWVVVGVASAGFFRWGITAVVGVIALLVAACFVVKGGRETLRIALRGMVEGAKSAVPVGVACALVGTIIAVMTLTGLAGSFAQSIIGLAHGNLFFSLVLTMLISLVLGMGIPTIPNYIITSSLVAPTLLDLGVPLIISHMFVFYFGIMADLTPPVALAAFAASSIAKASGLRIGMQCMRIAIAGFVVPYMAVYDNALMLQTSDPVAVIYILTKATLSVGLWGAASIGFLFAPLSVLERLLAAAAAFALVAALPVTDEIGFLLAAVFLVQHEWRRRRAARTA